MELLPESEIEFFLSGLSARFVFVRDRDGRVARLIIDQEGQKTIAEKKR